MIISWCKKKSHQVSQFCAFQRHEFVNAHLQMRQNFVWSSPANIKERECIPTLKSSWKKFFKDSKQQSRAHLLLSCQGGVYQIINRVLFVSCTFYWEIFNTIGMLDVFHCFICPIWPFNLALWLNLSSFSTLVGNLFITWLPCLKAFGILSYHLRMAIGSTKGSRFFPLSGKPPPPFPLSQKSFCQKKA